MCCSAEGWREEELLVQPPPHPPITPLYNTHGQKPVRRWTWPSCRSQSSADLHQHRIWTNHHNLYMLIFTSCKMKMKGWKTKSPKDKMQLKEHAWYPCWYTETSGQAGKESEVFCLHISRSTLRPDNGCVLWKYHSSHHPGSQAWNPDISTGGVGEMTPLFLLSIEIKPCATKGKRMQRSPRCVSNHSSVFK